MAVNPLFAALHAKGFRYCRYVVDDSLPADDTGVHISCDIPRALVRQLGFMDIEAGIGARIHLYPDSCLITCNVPMHLLMRDGPGDYTLLTTPDGVNSRHTDCSDDWLDFWQSLR